MPQPPERSCVIAVRPRLHVTLIGMDGVGWRHNGGIGFCVGEPHLQVRVSTATTFSLHDNRRHPLQDIEQTRLAKVAHGFARSPVRIEICGDLPSHYGFGSSTAIRLGTLEAIAHVLRKDMGRTQLLQKSGRGGTSGIGITTYFDGGLVFDVGIKDTRSPPLPSSVMEGLHRCPLVVKQLQMPDWRVGLCIPFGIRPQTEEEEVAFFKRACPITASASHETLYHVVYGLLASAQEHDFVGFCNAIKAIQRCPWKQMERALYGEPLLQVETSIYDAGAAAVGMSSLGPGLFFFANDVDTVAESLRTAQPHHTWRVGLCHNFGRLLLSQ